MRATVAQPAVKAGRDTPAELQRFTEQVRRALNDAYRVVTSAVTSDATPAVIWQGTLPEDTAWVATLSVVGRDPSGNVGAYERVVRWKRGTGAAAMLSSGIPAADYEDVAGWDVTADASGSDARVLVTGSVGSSVQWVCSVRLIEAPRPET